MDKPTDVPAVAQKLSIDPDGDIDELAEQLGEMVDGGECGEYWGALSFMWRYTYQYANPVLKAAMESEIRSQARHLKENFRMLKRTVWREVYETQLEHVDMIPDECIETNELD